MRQWGEKVNFTLEPPVLQADCSIAPATCDRCAAFLLSGDPLPAACLICEVYSHCLPPPSPPLLLAPAASPLPRMPPADCSTVPAACDGCAASLLSGDVMPAVCLGCEVYSHCLPPPPAPLLLAPATSPGPPIVPADCSTVPVEVEMEILGWSLHEQPLIPR